VSQKRFRCGSDLCTADEQPGRAAWVCSGADRVRWAPNPRSVRHTADAGLSNPPAAIDRARHGLDPWIPVPPRAQKLWPAKLRLWNC